MIDNYSKASQVKTVDSANLYWAIIHLQSLEPRQSAYLPPHQPCPPSQDEQDDVRLPSIHFVAPEAHNLGELRQERLQKREEEPRVIRNHQLIVVVHESDLTRLDILKGLRGLTRAKARHIKTV